MARRDGSSGRKDTEEVLSPEELDIAADENVAQIGSGRFVVGSDGPPNEEKVDEVRAQLAGAVEADHPDPRTEPEPADFDAQQGTRDDSTHERPAERLDGRAVKSWIDDQLESSESRYAYRIAAKSGESVSHQQLASDDIGMTFDALLMWYAQQVGRGTAVEEALGILLAESSLRVKYPTRRLLSYLDEHDLGPNDSIMDLIETVQDDGGLVFPPSQRDYD